MIPRSYQAQAAEQVIAAWLEHAATLVVMPTGTGKTILFADIIRRCLPRRALVVAHREELIFQAADKIERVTGLETGIEMADLKVRTATGDLFRDPPPVVISTIQTLTAGGDGAGRMGKFLPEDFGLLVIDEAHHATAATYRRVIAHFRQNPALRILGVTATPDRMDEAALGQVFDTVAFDYEIPDAIRDGWLCPIQQQVVEVAGLDFSKVRTTAGDLNGADLAAILEQERHLHGIADPTLEIVGTRRALVFAASVAQAEKLAEIFNRHRPNSAAWVSGKTPKDDRRSILANFAAGRTRILVNCAVLTEGFDDCGVEVVVMARPTKSRALYAQMAGRATRPLPGLVDGVEPSAIRRLRIAQSAKPLCLIVDFAGNAGRHRLVTAADILGGKYDDEAVEMAAAFARTAGGPVDVRQSLDQAAATIQLARDNARLAEAARRARVVAKAQYTSRSVDPFALLNISPWRARGWDEGKELSEKQRAILDRAGLDPDAYSYTQSKQLVGAIIDRFRAGKCTMKMAAQLARHGLDPDMPMEQARTEMDRLFGQRKAS